MAFLPLLSADQRLERGGRERGSRRVRKEESNCGRLSVCAETMCMCARAGVGVMSNL